METGILFFLSTLDPVVIFIYPMLILSGILLYLHTRDVNKEVYNKDKDDDDQRHNH